VTDPFADPRQLVDRVYAYAATMLGDGPAAEDVTSEAIERGLRYRASYDPRKGTPAAWLIGIARRAIADTPRWELASETSEVAAPGELERETVDRVALRAALAALAPRDRELLALRYSADLTARQIGGLLELKTNAVEVALHRALARLREQLAPVRVSGPAPVSVLNDALPPQTGRARDAAQGRQASRAGRAR
jgi:RNA polymerase sigma-70 factor (ECF subfamily)